MEIKINIYIKYISNFEKQGTNLFFFQDYILSLNIQEYQYLKIIFFVILINHCLEFNIFIINCQIF